MMTVPMDNSSAPSTRELAERLYKQNVELENGLRKSARSKVPSDPNAWLQMRENYEAIILEDHDFSEKHEIAYALWQLHYRRIEEFRAHIHAAASTGSTTSQGGKNATRPDRIKKIRSIFKSFLSEATGFYHDLILKIRAKYGLPLGYFSEGPEDQIILAKDEKKSAEMKKGLISCHRCLIYLGDLARYKGLYAEGDSDSRDYAAASSYYTQAASLWPSSGNPHHQLAIVASYGGDELVAIYRYFRSLSVDSPFSTARDNLIIAFEKNRQSYSQLPGNAKVSSTKTLPARMTGRGRGRGDTRLLAKDTKTESTPTKEQELSIPEIFKAFSTRFVRLNGILFTRTSLETFGETFSSVSSDLLVLLSSGPEEELNFGLDAAENGLFIVRLITILIFTVHNVNRESEGQSYAEILQRTVLLQNAFTAAFEFVGHILKRCIQLDEASSSFLLPAILVFIEWLACHPDIAAGEDCEEKQATARSLFWNQCVLFMNKLLLSGLVFGDGNEDETCFFDMSRYDEGETGNRLALWEDFELRGFSPLVPAQLILDFSRKLSFGTDGNNREKRARVQRILAAGRALMNVVRVGQQGIYFDSKLKKYVIGTEPPLYEEYSNNGFLDVSESNVTKQESPVEDTTNLGGTRSKAQLYVEGEEEDEVIVFQPMVAEKYPKINDLMPTAYEVVKPVQSPSKGDWASYDGILSAPLNNLQLPTAINVSSQLYATVPNISQQPKEYIRPSTSKWFMENEAFFSDGLKSLTIAENGLVSKAVAQEGLGTLQPTTLLPPFSEPANTSTGSMFSSQIKVTEAVIPSKLDSIVPSGTNFDGVGMKLPVSLSTTLRKNPVSRPVRHLGPPPGFSAAPSRQVDDSISSLGLKDQHPQMDDYCWLDGYQSEPTKGLGMENSINHTANMYSHVTMGNSNSFTGALSFPFPGKQIPTVQTSMENDKRWQEFQRLEHLKLYKDQQLQQANQQPAPLPEQFEAQSLWSGRYFV